LEGCLNMTEIHERLCAYARDEGLPCINYRISCDYGAVVLMKSKDSSLDMIGPPLNMCSKINHFAQPNGIVIGGDLYEMVKKIDDYNFTSVKSYHSDQKFQYSVYAVTRR
ncbi:MAG: adenylate/guanylate cyclase domain-containing protein, partial [Nitrosarchaeum sp.]